MSTFAKLSLWPIWYPDAFSFSYEGGNGGGLGGAAFASRSFYDTWRREIPMATCKLITIFFLWSLFTWL